MEQRAQEWNNVDDGVKLANMRIWGRTQRTDPLVTWRQQLQTDPAEG